MGKYTNGLKISIQRQIDSGLTPKASFAVILHKLCHAKATYQGELKDILGLINGTEPVTSEEIHMFNILKHVQEATCEMTRDLEELQNSGWPEAEMALTLGPESASA